MLRATTLVITAVTGVGSIIATASQTSSTADWMQDLPGRVHRIDLAQLPAPYASELASNSPKIVPRPADARLQVPDGFKVELLASGLDGPRTMRLAANGDLYVAETRTGRVSVLHFTDGAAKPSRTTFTRGLTNPFGMQFYPRREPKWLYVAETNRVVRYSYQNGQLSATATPEVIVLELAPKAGGGHITRDLVFTPDERRMFVSVGSSSNVAEDMPKKDASEVQAWQGSHALGAAWDAESNRADVLVFNMNSEGGVSDSGRVYASGLRNCAGLTIEPRSGDLWCTVNERDMLGDNLVPDYSTRVREGGFYGWPWYYMGNHEDPRLKGARPDLAGKVSLPDVPYQSHSAPLNLIFYAASTGASAFPAQYDGDGFAVLHGSWNRSSRTGYKVVRVRMNNGVPTGEYDDFMVGFIVDSAEVWGRPVGALEERDGALLISDDGGGAIWRISYAH